LKYKHNLSQQEGCIGDLNLGRLDGPLPSPIQALKIIPKRRRFRRSRMLKGFEVLIKRIEGRKGCH